MFERRSSTGRVCVSRSRDASGRTEACARYPRLRTGQDALAYQARHELRRLQEHGPEPDHVPNADGERPRRIADTKMSSTMRTTCGTSHDGSIPAFARLAFQDRDGPSEGRGKDADGRAAEQAIVSENVTGILKLMEDSTFPVTGIFSATQNIPGSADHDPGKRVDTLNADCRTRTIKPDARGDIRPAAPSGKSPCSS